MSEEPLTATPSHEDLWVFGYGSLMWRPGFDFIEQVPARLIGEHRALCVYSFDHRGTPEKPGLVLGLDRGGACRGIAFRIAAARRDDTVNYLREREQTTNVYREVMRSVWLENEARGRVSALAYVVDRGQCAICRAAFAERTAAFRPPGPRPLGKQSRLRALHRALDRGARLSRFPIASIGRNAARRHSAASLTTIESGAATSPPIRPVRRVCGAEIGERGNVSSVLMPALRAMTASRYTRAPAFAGHNCDAFDHLLGKTPAFAFSDGGPGQVSATSGGLNSPRAARQLPSIRFNLIGA